MRLPVDGAALLRDGGVEDGVQDLQALRQHVEEAALARGRRAQVHVVVWKNVRAVETALREGRIAQHPFEAVGLVERSVVREGDVVEGGGGLRRVHVNAGDLIS